MSQARRPNDYRQAIETDAFQAYQQDPTEPGAVLPVYPRGMTLDAGTDVLFGQDKGDDDRKPNTPRGAHP